MTEIDCHERWNTGVRCAESVVGGILFAMALRLLVHLQARQQPVQANSAANQHGALESEGTGSKLTDICSPRLHLASLQGEQFLREA